MTGLAEQWLPIAKPDTKDLPPIAQETLNNPKVVQAQAMLEMQWRAAAEEAAKTQAARDKYIRAARSRRQRRKR